MTSDEGAGGVASRRREWRARLLGVAVALAAATTAMLTIRWPAPGISVALGIAVYLLARNRRG